MRFLGVASLFVTAALAVAQSPLTTTMVGGLVLTGYTTSNTLYFDVNITNPNGLIFTQFDLRSQQSALASSIGIVDVYVTALGGSQSPNRANPAAWTKVGTANTTNVGTTNAILNTPFYLATGTYGMAIHMQTIQAVYTNPATPVPPLGTSFSNADMTINCVDARIQNSTATAPFGGGVSAVRTPNVSIYYSTSQRVVNFTAATRTGSSPLSVGFTSSAITTVPGGILAYTWDCDGDGIVDSSLQNPTFIYNNCGTYNVSLTIFDAAGQDVVTKTGYIVVDPITASFTWTKTAFTNQTSTYQFTDTSTGTVINRAWDLNGDGVVDSNAQNPTWTYAANCVPTNVTLTTTNTCRTATSTLALATKSEARTLFNANNGGVVGAGCYFDVNVTNPDGISLCGVYANCNTGAGVGVTATVYITPTTYVGNDANAAVWTQIGSGTALTANFNSPTYFQFATNSYLAPGSYGMAVFVGGGTGPAYSGTGTSPLPGATTYSNGDVSYTLGIARSAPFAGTAFTPRIWNGALVYETTSQGLAVYRKFGNGCPGTIGVPTNVATTMPKVGTTLNVSIGNLIANAGFFILGLSNTFGSFGPLPLDLAILGAPGCTSYVSADSVSLILGANNSANFAFNLPNSPSYLGVRFFTQSAGLDVVNPLGLVVGDAASAVIGL